MPRLLRFARRFGIVGTVVDHGATASVADGLSPLDADFGEHLLSKQPLPERRFDAKLSVQKRLVPTH